MVDWEKEEEVAERIITTTLRIAPGAVTPATAILLRRELVRIADALEGIEHIMRREQRYKDTGSYA